MFFEISLKRVEQSKENIWKNVDYYLAFETAIFNYFLGIMSTNEVGINYLKSTNFMFLGGLILAMAVEQSGLHQRVALKIMMMIGTNPRNLLLGFMLTTGKK